MYGNRFHCVAGAMHFSLSDGPPPAWKPNPSQRLLICTCLLFAARAPAPLIYSFIVSVKRYSMRVVYWQHGNTANGQRGR